LEYRTVSYFWSPPVPSNVPNTRQSNRINERLGNVEVVLALRLRPPYRMPKTEVRLHVGPFSPSLSL
ncbi:hypothetical protein J6590_001731, partial [Homalodisca vitripennis]